MSYDRLVMPFDEPKCVITVKAAGTVSGGDLVMWNSGTDCVGSDISTYASSDIAVVQCSTKWNCIGIALDTVTSGQIVAIALDGIFILPAGSTAVTANENVVAAGYGNMVDGISDDASGLQSPIGRALTSATALTGFAIVKLNI
jgi:predicted RecA/RadA family phage recombinase